MEYLAFMAALRHCEIESVIEDLGQYEIGTYLIGLETATGVHLDTEGQHMHFLVQIKLKDYNAFVKRIFVDKYKLRGRALKDKPKQYGKVKKIEDLGRLMSYTVKDGNVHTNMSQHELDVYCQASFKKREDKKFIDDVMQ